MLGSLNDLGFQEEKGKIKTVKVMRKKKKGNVEENAEGGLQSAMQLCRALLTSDA